MAAEQVSANITGRQVAIGQLVLPMYGANRGVSLWKQQVEFATVKPAFDDHVAKERLVLRILVAQ